MAKKSGKKSGKKPTKKSKSNNKANKKVPPTKSKSMAKSRAKRIEGRIINKMGSYEKKDHELRRDHKKLLFGNALPHLGGKTLKVVFKETIEASSSVSDFYRGIQDAETEFELDIPVGTEYSSLVLRGIRKAKTKGLDIHEVWAEATENGKPTGKIIENIITERCVVNNEDKGKESKGDILADEIIGNNKLTDKNIKAIVRVLGMKCIKSYIALSKSDQEICLEVLNDHIG